MCCLRRVALVRTTCVRVNTDRRDSHARETEREFWGNDERPDWRERVEFENDESLRKSLLFFKPRKRMEIWKSLLSPHLCFVVTPSLQKKRKEKRNKQHTGWGGGWWWCVAAVIALSVVARCPSTTTETETAEEDRRARAPGERNAWFLWTY